MVVRVYFGHTLRLREACPDAMLWAIEGYEHVGAYTYPSTGGGNSAF